MARFSVGDGIANYIDKLGNLEFYAEDHVGKAIYEGAKVVADAVDASIDTIPTREKGSARGVYDYQREGLKNGLGIAKMRNDNGFYNVKIGFDGYNGHVTKSTSSKGQANAMIARSIERGTSFSPPIHFVSKAVNRVKKQAEDAMQKSLEKNIKKTMS